MKFLVAVLCILPLALGQIVLPEDKAAYIEQAFRLAASNVGAFNEFYNCIVKNFPTNNGLSSWDPSTLYYTNRNFITALGVSKSKDLQTISLYTNGLYAFNRHLGKILVNEGYNFNHVALYVLVNAVNDFFISFESIYRKMFVLKASTPLMKPTGTLPPKPARVFTNATYISDFKETASSARYQLTNLRKINLESASLNNELEAVNYLNTLFIFFNEFVTGITAVYGSQDACPTFNLNFALIQMSNRLISLPEQLTEYKPDIKRNVIAFQIFMDVYSGVIENLVAVQKTAGGY